MRHAHSFEFTDAPDVGHDDFIVRIPAGLASTQSLLQAMFDALKLPGYFGFNWNALSDCLRDFHWLKQRKVVLQHVDLPAIPTADLRAYLEVLAEAALDWGPDEEHSLNVVFPATLRNEVARLMNT